MKPREGALGSVLGLKEKKKGGGNEDILSFKFLLVLPGFEPATAILFIIFSKKSKKIQVPIGT